MNLLNLVYFVFYLDILRQSGWASCWLIFRLRWGDSVCFGRYCEKARHLFLHPTQATLLNRTAPADRRRTRWPRTRRTPAWWSTPSPTGPVSSRQRTRWASSGARASSATTRSSWWATRPTWCALGSSPPRVSAFGAITGQTASECIRVSSRKNFKPMLMSRHWLICFQRHFTALHGSSPEKE